MLNAKVRLGDIYRRAQEKYTEKKKKVFFVSFFFFPKEDRQTDSLEKKHKDFIIQDIF